MQWAEPGAVGRERTVANEAGGSKSRSTYKVGYQWDIPLANVLLYAGEGAQVMDSKSILGDWFNNVLELAAPPSSHHYFNDLIKNLAPNHMVCSRKGLIPGGKFKLFAGRAEAMLFRQLAYNRAGIGFNKAKGTSAPVLPHPAYPPRKITLIDRKGMNGRGIYNRPDIVKAVEATGVPFEEVNSMAKLSFAEQVHLMAGTGILIAPHGAALANIMFLPAHAVVIEMFPYLMKKNTYRYLSHLFDLVYYPLYSWELLSPNTTGYYGVELMNEMYFYNNCVATNISSFDALNVHACNAASKNYPIVVSVNVSGGKRATAQRRGASR